VKKRLTIAIVAGALAAATSLAAAGYYQRQRAQVAPADTLPASEILNKVTAFGLRPTTQALRRGPYYVLHAVDRRGVEVRVMADAQLGDIVSVAPLMVPRFNSGPRIIHVPQPGDRSERAGPYEGDEAAVPDGGDDDNAAPPPPRRRPASNRPAKRIEAPPARASADPLPERAKPEPKELKPLGPPRNVLSAPPPPPANSLTPIYPTPKFDAGAQEKFIAPDARAETPLSPPGYTPPRRVD
jgi:hypothetical protein